MDPSPAGNRNSKRLPLPTAILFDELIAEVRGYREEGAFDDDVCLVGLDYAGRPEAKPG